VSLPLRTGYCASKFAVNGFFDALYLEEDENISISIFMPGTINGSNFRANSLSGSIPPSVSKNVLTLEEAVQYCINGADRRIRHIYAPHKAYGYQKLHATWPGLLDTMIKAEAKL
jgi:short-subunit dehydrogenase